MRSGLLLALAALLSGGGCAEKACEAPADLPRPMLEGPSVKEPRRLLPIGGYTLALSWSPEYCATRMTSPRDHLQCGGGAGKFGFILHGLWPDGEGRQWPQYCAPARLVPEALIREHFCTMPSVQLIQHEWEKHGTCMAKTPDEYMAKSRALFGALRFPDMADYAGRTITAGTFREAFAAANEGMRPDQLRIDVSGDGWLEGVLVCLDKGFDWTVCPTHQRTAPPEQAIRIR